MQYQSQQSIDRIQSQIRPFSDAHCHLELFEKPEQAVREAREKGVGLIITAGSSEESNNQIMRLANEDSVFAVIGISPDFSNSSLQFLDSLATLVKKNKHIVGIGEIGLDMKIANSITIDLQIKAFVKQIEIANQLDLPIVIHSRKALDEVTKVISENNVKKAMFHFFEGDEEQAKALEKKGYLISISPGESGRKRRIIKALDINNIVAETDSPVVGKTPIDVIKVVESIAKIKSLSIEEVAERTTNNLREFFYI